MKRFFREEKVFALIFILCLLSLLRVLIIPLQGDELTYNELANNILKGKYYQVDHPSTVAPIVPFIIALFKIQGFAVAGLVLAKLFHMALLLFGFRYLFLFLKRQRLDIRVIWSILALTAVNPIGIHFFGSLYPESILFFCFWGVLYYSGLGYSTSNYVKLVALFLLISMTRYLYLVLGLIVLIYFLKYIKAQDRKEIHKILLYTLILMIPVVLWAKYVYNIEQNNLSEISYFKRFKPDNQLLYNIKAGLGLIKHEEVSRVNGIPAFVSLFVPITGLRHYLGSVMLILAFAYGYVKNIRTDGIRSLVLAMTLTMLGLVFAGTGFSRYWLVLLPGFFLGYYFLASKFKIKDQWFVYGAQILSFIYIANEIRLDILILNRHL